MATLDNCASNNREIIASELYFLIAKFLSHGPFQNVGEVLRKSIEEQKILPKRLDWTGIEHEQTFAELERKYAHVGPEHLLQICGRVTSLLNKEIPPSVAGVLSLIGAGRQSVLRTIENISKPRSLASYITRVHSMPLLDPSQQKINHNIVKVLFGRETSGSITRKHTITNEFYSKLQLLRRTLGHLSAVYCVLFDRTGKYIITGADDLLVKLWSAIDGRLLTTFRGASSEITDIAINLDNTLMAAGSLDHILRVWDLQTAAPIAVLAGHTGMITSVNFCPSPKSEMKYLVTTSTDGSVAFWKYMTPRGQRAIFEPKPTQYHEKIRPGTGAQMIYASFSPGGTFVAAGSADHHVRVYHMTQEKGPQRILETEAHSDTVDSIQWAHNGLRFISGSKDGTAHVWHFETQQWKSMRLYMSERLPSCPPPADDGKKLKVTMVAWDLTDKYVITAVSDHTIKVWDADTGKLHRVMRGHTDELYVLESHPKDPYILISAGHDGQLCVWDIQEGKPLTQFANQIDGQGHGGVFDAKWSPDGTMIAATDSHGHILMYGFGSGHGRLKTLPNELFFHTDYRPLIRDANHYVMDEQTQTVPHLMPPPFLVDVDGNPYPPAFQRLVPGRESCTAEQLVPNISVGPEGMEVVEGPNAMSNIDRMIEALANRQHGPSNEPNNEQRNGQAEIQAAVVGGNVGGAHQLGVSPAAAAATAAMNRLINPNAPADGGVDAANAVNQNAVPIVPVSRSSARPIGLPIRRSGDVEGVRQSLGNWTSSGAFKWIRRTYVRPMAASRLHTLKNTVYTAGNQEYEAYRREMRRRPVMINTSAPSSSIPRAPTILRGRHIGRTRNTGQRVGNASSNGSLRPTPAYRTRAQREEERRDNDDDDDQSVTSASSDSSDGTVAEDQISSSSSSSDSESSDYSDWVGAANQATTLEPPKRSRRKPVRPRMYSPEYDNQTDQSRPNTSRAGVAGRRQVGSNNLPLSENGEIPEEYRPPEWLSEVIPRKAPYYPQMGDEVIYLRQGHQRYLEAVRAKDVYKLTNISEPWSHLDLREHELVKVIGIKYEIKPPRLCCLKLGLMENDGRLSRRTFTIKYHDMPDVIDFIVLRQTFDTAVQRLWRPGDRFRCMIDDGWWMGKIESRVPLQPEEFPNSLFMCFNVRWDNGEYECMSPWDMEPIDERRVPNEVGGVVYVEPEEIRATLYQPTNEEWPRGDRDGTCRRIVEGLGQVMLLRIAEPFLVPVDLNIYPSYAFIVEYPIDLSTIKARFENHFYRRITSAQFDVRYLATNAEKFNQTNSHIVKNARIITDLCLKIIKETNTVDVNALYHQLMDTYQTSDSEDGQRPGTSTGGVTPSLARSKKSRSTRRRADSDWRVTCREILEIIWNSQDSEPFREPVDLLELSDYLQVIDTPMDLMTIKEDLVGGNYDSPAAFVKDVRLIFANSRNYNTNKRSPIYAMTLRLSQLFEAQLWRLKGVRSTETRRTNGYSRLRAAKRNARASANTSTTPSTNGASSSRTHRRTNNSNQYLGEQGNDNDVEDVLDNHRPSTSTSRRRTVVASTPEVLTSRRRNQNNGVSSSYEDATPGPSTSRGNTSTAATTRLRRNRSQEASDDSYESSQHSMHGSSSDDDSDEGIPTSELGTRSALRKRQRHHSDSEESYNPTPKRKSSRRLEKTKKTSNSRRGGKRVVPDAHEEESEQATSEEEYEEEEEESSPQNKPLPRKRSNRLQLTDDEEDDEQKNNDVDVEGSEDEQASQYGRGIRRRNLHNHAEPSPGRSRTRRRISSHHSDDNYEVEATSSRPTRSAVKRTQIVAQTIRTTTNRTRVTRNLYADADSDAGNNENDTLQVSQTSTRSTRSVVVNRSITRSTRNPNSLHDESYGNDDDDDDDESDDNQVLSQIANQRTRPTRRSHEPHPSISTNGSAPRGRELSRRKQASTSPAVASNSVSLDHNYGEPGPSSLRNSRRIPMLSRHQRNADELDIPTNELSATPPGDPLRLPERVSRRLRDRPQTNAISSTSRRSSRLHVHDYEEVATEPEEAVSEADEESGAAEASEEEEEDQEEEAVTADSSDPDDDKPLGHLVASQESQRPLRARTTRSQELVDTSARGSRGQKRPYYNEDSDDESINGLNRRPAVSSQSDKRRRTIAYHSYSDDNADENEPLHASQTRRSRANNGTSHKNGRANHHHDDDENEDDTDDDDDDDDQPQVSISSRGRVRKISNRAKNYFRD